MKSYYENGYEVVISDESLFSPDYYKLRHWMPTQNPIMKVSKFSDFRGPMPRINVCSVISEQYGNIHNHFSEQYFTS